MNYSYDVEGRLAKASQAAAPGNGGVYGYDALNRLVSRTVTSGTTTTTIYVHDINNHIIAERDAAGVTHREYIWLDDLPVALVDQVDTASPQIFMVHTDHLGRPVLLISTAGARAAVELRYIHQRHIRATASRIHPRHRVVSAPSCGARSIP
jgi:uncharacterized protein RhaS with RHS repeats